MNDDVRREIRRLHQVCRVKDDVIKKLLDILDTKSLTTDEQRNIVEEARNIIG